MLRFLLGWVATLVVTGLTSGDHSRGGARGRRSLRNGAARRDLLGSKPSGFLIPTPKHHTCHTFPTHLLKPRHPHPPTAALFTAQGIYSPNNNGAGRRSKLDFYLINSTEIISGALAGSGVPGTLEQSAQLNASLAALPTPLLDATQGIQVQAQALQFYAAATTWITNAVNATAGGG